MSILRRHIDEGYKSMKLTRLVLVLLATGIVAATSHAQPIATNVWTDFGSAATTINGVPMPIGSIVQAYDPQGVLCGQVTATVAGKYGAMSVYGDDAFSAGVDEGCLVGDVVTFKINGQTAYKLGPGSDVWSGLGPTVVMNLATSDITIFDLTVVGPDGDAGEAGTTVTYTVEVYNNGDGVDLVTVTALSQNGWTVTGGTGPGGQFIGAGEHVTIQFQVTIPPGAGVGTQDILTVTATSQFSPAENFVKQITTTVDQQTAVDDVDFVVPGQFALAQNYPNPFNPETRISFEMEKGADVSLEVFDILGRKVSTLHSGYLPTGSYEFSWYGADESGRQAASGIYFYRLSAGDKSITRKMTLLK